MAGPDLSYLGADAAIAPAPATALPAPAATARTGTPAVSAPPDLSHLGTMGQTGPDLSHLAAPAKRKPIEFTPLTTLKRTFAKNMLDLIDGLNEFAQAHTIGGKAWAGVEAVAAGLSIPFTPIEAGLTEFAGKPLEALTGIPAPLTGEIGSLGAMLLLDPIGGATTVARAVRGGRLASDIIGKLAPEAVSEGAGRMAGLIREAASLETTHNQRVRLALQRYRREIDRQPDPWQWAVKIQQGHQPQATPLLQEAADVFRKLQDETTVKLQQMGQRLGKNILPDANKFYFGQRWAERGEAEALQALQQGKRPLTGSGSFLRQRTYQDIAEGLAAGEKVAFDSPIDMALFKFQEQHRFLYGTQLAGAIKKSGLAKFYRSGQRVPLGWKEMDDRVFRAILPRAEGGAGPQLAGKWWAPEDVAKVFNNYVGPSKARGAFPDSIRAMAMGLNMAQLGLSAFHATFTTVDVMISQLARSIMSAMRGHFGEAAIQALAVPTAAVTTVRRGGRLYRNLMNPENLSKEEKMLTESFNLGGGRASMDWYMKATDRSLVRGLRDGTFIRSIQHEFEKSPLAEVLKLPFQIAGAAVSDIAYPIMEYLVPRQKLGVFANLASDWLRRNPNATRAAWQHEMIKIWNSVDNRLGQMVYDNIFINKTAKDIMFMTVRSVGWNMGTIRELGGGVVDAAKAISALRAGDQAEFTHRMAYVIAMPIVTGIIGAALTYLYTGRGPREMNDYFFPPTGNMTPRGARERVIIPSYIKDVLEYNNEPVRTVVAKLNPLWETVIEFYNNRDFHGGLIRDPRGDFVSQARDLAVYMENQMLPFSIRSAKRLGKEGAALPQQVGSFFGFQAAPAWITDPERAEMWQRLQDMRALRRRMRGEATR